MNTSQDNSAGANTIDQNSYWGDILYNVTTPASSVLRLIANNTAGGASTALNANTTTMGTWFVLNTAVDLTLSGSYSTAGALTLTLTATEDSDHSMSTTITSNITTSLTTSPFSGMSFFGFRQSAGSNTANTSNYNNFIFTASPEPESLGLIGISALGLGLRRRRDRRHATASSFSFSNQNAGRIS